MKPARAYTLGEEIFSAVTHGTGALLSISGCAIAIVWAALFGSAISVVSASVYGASLILTYAMSTLYHSLTHKKAKKVFQVLDHSTIYLLIAGTYTPIALCCLRGAWGWVIFGIVWAACLFGITLNGIDMVRFKRVSMICYMASGWAVLIALWPLVRSMATGGLVLLFLGGVCYTGGILFYQAKSVRYMHPIWHLFVLAGSALHYFCVLLYALPGH